LKLSLLALQTFFAAWPGQLETHKPWSIAPSDFNSRR
jgi:hypothetical protein